MDEFHAKQEQIVANIGANLSALSQIGAEVESAESEVLVQEGATLQKLVEKVLPIMRYIDYRVKVRGSVGGGQWADWSYEYYPEKAIVLVDNSHQKNTDGKGQRGIYEGPSLLLTRSGKFILLIEDGEWSNWQDEGSYWNEEISEISIEQAIQRFDMVKIIQGLAEAFQESIQKAEKKKQTLGSRLQQLEQIEAILK